MDEETARHVYLDNGPLHTQCIRKHHAHDRRDQGRLDRIIAYFPDHALNSIYGTGAAFYFRRAESILSPGSKRSRTSIPETTRPKAV